MRSTHSIVLVSLIVLATGTLARAAEDIATLSDKEQTLAVEGEVATTNAETDEQMAADTAKETSQVKGEVKNLERQARQADSAEQRASRGVALQTKKLEQAQVIAKSVRKKLAQSTSRQHSTEAKLAHLKDLVQVQERQAHEAHDKNVQQAAEIAKMDKAMRELKVRRKAAVAQMQREKMKAKQLRKKRHQVASN